MGMGHKKKNLISRSTTLKLFIIAIAISVFHTESQAASKCSSAFFEAVPIGALRPEFEHTTHYTKEIKQTRITNQCNLGTCHLYSWTGHLEASYLKRTGEELPLSADYLSYMHFYLSSVEALARTNNEVTTQLGANPVQSLNLVRKYGLRPEGAFNIGPDFKTGTPSARAKALIQNYTARVQLELSKIQDPTKKQKAFQRRAKELESLFEEMFGVVPKDFVYKGKTYNARTFAQEHFPEIFQKLTVYDIQHRVKEKFQKTIDSPVYETFAIDRNTMDELIMRQIDQGKNVYLSYEHKHELVDKETGIMSVQAFNIPLKMLPLPQNRREQFKLSDGGHAVQIVGYESDPLTNQLIKIKIKNSWGEKNGDSGYFHMYRDYLHTFVRKIVTLP